MKDNLYHPREKDTLGRIQLGAMARVLDERIPLHPHFYVQMLHTEYGERAADVLLEGRPDLQTIEAIIWSVPTRRAAAWNHLIEKWNPYGPTWFRSKERINKLWETYLSFVERLAANRPIVSQTEEDHEHLWKVLHQIFPDPTNQSLVSVIKIATGALAALAVQTLIERKENGHLVTVVKEGYSGNARLEAGKALLSVDPHEETLVLIINELSSLRRHAARKLVDLPLAEKRQGQ